ncbi:MAG: hypothetical protein KAT86_04400 [Candidatus Latescibacteria bacterium]|nr:hypothetical protein [Candidatus Latescibacterota bacterium]
MIHPRKMARQSKWVNSRITSGRLEATSRLIVWKMRPTEKDPEYASTRSITMHTMKEIFLCLSRFKNRRYFSQLTVNILDFIVSRSTPLNPSLSQYGAR